MSKLRHVTVGVFAAAAFLFAPAVPAVSAPGDPVVLFYDASRAAEFVDAVKAGAESWNLSVTSVRLEPVPAGGTAQIVIEASDGWPEAGPQGLGRGIIKMGRQAVREGHFPPRIAAHEFGHIFGLPDDRTGLCDDLMAGSSAAPPCDVTVPNAEEAARVQQAFAGSSATSPSGGVVVLN